MREGLLALGGLVWYLLARRKRKQEEIEEYESLAEEEVATTDETIMEIPEEKLEPTEQAEPTEPTLDEQVQDACKRACRGHCKSY